MTLPPLSRQLLRERAGNVDGVRVPAHALRDVMPERAVQFGTGALLRGLIEPLLDDAIARGELDGRVVMVGQTGSGRDRAINRQDGLFTLVTRGLVDGEARSERRVIASVSRALSAADEWEAVLAVARSPELRMVFSNTTEAGLALDASDAPDADPPRSFPGKLTRFLWERARAFDFGDAGGLAILPTELIAHNGAVLRDAVLALARRWALGGDFERWVGDSVAFLDTLVDRIVPGTPSPAERAKYEAEVGYGDELLTVAERYALIAIQHDGGELPFTGGGEGEIEVVMDRDITPYRERKLRLLNGTHTAMTPLALLCGCDTVREAMGDGLVGRFVERAMLDEIAPYVSAPDAERFAREVLERFANPYLHHAVADIALQQTMKLRVRVVPSILAYARATGEAPPSLAFAFAAYLRFARGDLQRDREAARRPLPRDDGGPALRAIWQQFGDDPVAVARHVCAGTALWGADLSAIPGFSNEVAGALVKVMKLGAPAALALHMVRGGVEVGA
jgi:tagaturonate reductase